MVPSEPLHGEKGPADERLQVDNLTSSDESWISPMGYLIYS